MNIPLEDDFIDNYNNGRPAEKTIKFLRIVENYPILYNEKHPEWYNLEETRKALEAVAEKCKTIPRMVLTIKQTEIKLRRVICTYRIERNKVKGGGVTKCKYYTVADSILGPYVSDTVKKGGVNLKWKERPGEGKKVTRRSKEEMEAVREYKKTVGKAPKKEDVYNRWDPNFIAKQQTTPNYNNNSNNKNKLHSNKNKKKKGKRRKDETTSDEDSNSGDDWQNDEIPYSISVRVKEEPRQTTLKDDSKSRKWSNADTMDFINKYKSNTSLWDKSHADFADKAKRMAILTEMAKSLNWPKEKIMKKIIILKQTYNSERKKIEDALVLGEFYQSNLSWFPMVDSFLAPSAGCFQAKTDNPTNFVDTTILRPIVKLEIPKHESDKDDEDDDTDHAHDDNFDNDDFNDDASQNNKGSKDSSKNSESSSGSDSEDNLFGGDFNLKKIKWQYETTIKFIRLYGAHKCLWDLKDKDFNDEKLRQAAFIDIAEAMGHGLDAKYVEKKIAAIKNTYLQERKRIANLANKKQNCEYRLKWYPLADCFLHQHVGVRTFKTVAVNYPKYDYEYVFKNSSEIHPSVLSKIDVKTEKQDQNWW